MEDCNGLERCVAIGGSRTLYSVYYDAMFLVINF